MTNDLGQAARFFADAIVGDLEKRLEHLQRVVEDLHHQIERMIEADNDDRNEERYLNQKEVAKFLGVSEEFIRVKRKEGAFPEPIKLSPRDIRWPRSVVKDWMESHKPSTSAGDQGPDSVEVSSAEDP